jgi:hypothetical protein
MCVIIEKQPGKSIPYEHLLAGAHRNPDGYGAVVVDRGKLEIIRGFSKDFKQGADQVAKLLEDATDKLAYVHYRFKTKGDVNIENVHPFKCFKTNNVELVFMHNGTVTGFGGGAVSDSRALCEEIIAPLAKRSASFLGDENVCSDPLMASVLHQVAGGTYNKFVLLDSLGQSIVINRDSGAEQDYGWSSNAYSLDTQNIRKFIDTEPVANTYVPTNSKVVSLAGKLDKAKGNNKSSTRLYHPSIRQTTAELIGYNLKDFCYLDAEQVRVMVRDQPDLSAVLILDLLAHVYDDEFKYISVG